MITILELLQEDGFKPVHATAGECDSECPWCGGKDRFSCFPEQKNSNGRYMGGRYVCRQCGVNGDAVNYLLKRRGVPFWKAVKYLGVDAGESPFHRPSNFVPLWQPDPPKPSPSDTWQFRALAFVARCVDQLKDNPNIMTWLRASRGLTDETIKAARLGWNPTDIYEDREAWGLEPETNNQTGKQKKLWMPAGLVIPLHDKTSNIIRLRIRKHEPKDGARYVVVSGSRMAPMIFWLEQQTTVCIVESELDGLLVHQQAGDIVAVVALGSAQTKPDSVLHQRLIHAKRILCALDYDSAGARSSKFYNRYSGYHRWPSCSGKDIADMFEAGAPIRLWIKAGLR